MKKMLLLGSTGKMGSAVKATFETDYDVICKNSKDFDACNFDDVVRLVTEHMPDIVINTVVFLGIAQCEKQPNKALLLNTLYPKLLAELSNDLGYLLIHFSTDAVFNDAKGDYYYESDAQSPVNMYGFTKHGGDCFVREISENYYIFRISILFGETDRDTQFIEKMIKRVREGQRVLKVADDIISSPSYTADIAKEVKRIVYESLPFGLYHIANKGKASLYDLMCEIAKCLELDVKIERASHKDFHVCGIKNTYTPISSEKAGRLRSWQEAVRDYCIRLEEKMKRNDLNKLYVRF